MSRIQLALNVPDLEAAIDFYSTLFGTTPNKTKPGYANFAIADPPVKLVLFESADTGTRLNHLGIEVASTEDVQAAQSRLADAGLAPFDDNGTCCFATQEKVWVDGPDGVWEIYTVVADAEEFGRSATTQAHCC